MFSISSQGITVCLGGVCVPLHLLLPFLVVLLHQRGYFKWVNPDWFDPIKVYRAYVFAPLPTDPKKKE